MNLEQNNTYIHDKMEFTDDVQILYEKTLKWLKCIYAEIIELKKDSIIAKHVNVITTTEFLTTRFWHKIIKIKFIEKNGDKFIDVEISRDSDYLEHPVQDPYIGWRELLLDYYAFIGIEINDIIKRRVFSEEHMGILLSKRKKNRSILFGLMVLLLSLSILFLYNEYFNIFLISLLGFFLIGLAFGLVHMSCLEVINYIKASIKN